MDWDLFHGAKYLSEINSDTLQTLEKDFTFGNSKFYYAFDENGNPTEITTGSQQLQMTGAVH